MSVQWISELPPGEIVHKGGKYDWEGIARELKKRPGHWAIVARNVPRSTATAIKDGKRKAFRPPEDWKVVTRGPAGSRGDLHMAYVGQPGAALVAEREMKELTGG